MTRFHCSIILRSGLAALLLCGAGSKVAAQNVPTSQADLPRSSASDALSQNLSQLVRNPRDISALIGAGDAALELGDPQAALGFYGRADDVSGLNGRVKAGLGRAMLAMQQTPDALRLMNQATSLGYSDKHLFSDRGLARDLTGDQVGAQSDYQAALRLAANDTDVIRRYAVSLGISGQLDQAEKIIQPLLYKSDRGAWRDRAFILAMNGKQEQAKTITKQVMPVQLATAIQPYMDRMHMLSAAQRAEAVHFGKFPPGLVRIAVAPTRTPPAQVQVAAALTASPPPRNQRRSKVQADTQVASAAVPARSAPNWDRSARQASPAAQPAPQARPVQGPPAAVVEAPTRASSPPPIDYSRVEPLTGAPQRPEPTPLATAPVPQAASAPAPAPAAPVSAPTPQAIAPSALAPAQPEPPAPVIGSAPAVVPAAAPATSTRSLAAIMAEVQVPEAEQQQGIAPVDLAEIAALQAERRKAKLAAEAKAKKDAEAKAKKEAEAKAKAEALAEKKRLAANPARIWVQVATGRSTSALAFDLKKMRKKYADAMGSKGAGTAAWGSTNRLVVGPFASSSKAKDFEAAMKKAGSDAFVWNSDAGEEVSLLGGK